MKKLVLTALMLGTFSTMAGASDAVVLTPQIAASINNPNAQTWQVMGVQPNIAKMKREAHLDQQQIKQFSQEVKALSSRLHRELEELINERFHIKK